MGKVHSLIVTHGVEAARAMAASKTERTAVNLAAEILAEEEYRLGITHAGFAMTALPHKRIEGTVWKRQGGPHATLLVASGHNRDGSPIGIPYGSMARLILLYLQTEAVRTGSAEVELGPSMNAWISRMALSKGGKTYQLVAEQARRISACRLTFFVDRSGVKAFENGAFVKGGISMGGMQDIDQPSFWQEKVRLDEDFFRSLREHPVPVREEAIRVISTRSMAIDVYIWLAYRLHVLAKPTPISWLSIHSQFGAGFKHVRQIKQTFIEALSLATAVYPEAHVEVEPEGLILYPSKPAIPKSEFKRLGLS